METPNNKVESKGMWRIAILAVIILIAAFFLKQYFGPKGHTLKIKEETLKVTLAEIPAEQEKGLSGRQSLNDGEGMLFVFTDESSHPFWMKDMNFPIDIIWINSNKEIVTIEQNLSPESYPKTFLPKEDAQYVLEVRAFYTRDHSIEVGDKVEF